MCENWRSVLDTATHKLTTTEYMPYEEKNISFSRRQKPIG